VNEKIGGLLSKEKDKLYGKGRLWFVVAYAKRETTVWTALTHFQPTLPWYLYKAKLQSVGVFLHPPPKLFDLLKF
jgi:hypothetical protein